MSKEETDLFIKSKVEDIASGHDLGHIQEAVLCFALKHLTGILTLDAIIYKVMELYAEIIKRAEEDEASRQSPLEVFAKITEMHKRWEADRAENIKGAMEMTALREKRAKEESGVQQSDIVCIASSLIAEKEKEWQEQLWAASDKINGLTDRIILLEGIIHNHR